MKKPFIVVFSIVIIIFFISFSLFYLFFTTKGLNIISKIFLSRYTSSDNIDIGDIEGEAFRQMSFKGISLQDLRFFPAGSSLNIAEVTLDINPFDLEGFYIEIDNGKLKISGSDPILFYGSYALGVLDISIYTKSLEISDISFLLEDNKDFKNIKGSFKEIDLTVKGSLKEPELTGTLIIESLQKDVLLIVDVPVTLDIKFKDIEKNAKIFGDIYLEGGNVSGPKTAVVNLKKGKISFSGIPEELKLDLSGISKVENTNINITLKGTIKKPDLLLSSEPSFPKERLLLMLATNKSWNMSEEDFSSGKMTVDIAKDFLDYFLFAGSGDKLAQFFGLKNITFQLDGKTKAIGVKKDISDSLNVKYDIEKEETSDKTTTTVQNIGTEYKVNDSVTIETNRELKQKNDTGLSYDPMVEDKAVLKYKKQF